MNPNAEGVQPARQRSVRVLAIDYGRRRLGLAISDELGITAVPLATLERKNRREDVKRLREIVRKQNVGCIVVGHPVRLDGSAGEMADEAAEFARRIEKELRLPVRLADERLSSWEAQQTISETRRGRKKRDGIDAVAAAVILRGFLERERDEKK
jgi:putative Holliday junction resolvase